MIRSGCESEEFSPSLQNLENRIEEVVTSSDDDPAWRRKVPGLVCGTPIGRWMFATDPRSRDRRPPRPGSVRVTPSGGDTVGTPIKPWTSTVRQYRRQWDPRGCGCSVPAQLPGNPWYLRSWSLTLLAWGTLRPGRPGRPKGRGRDEVATAVPIVSHDLGSPDRLVFVYGSFSDQACTPLPEVIIRNPGHAGATGCRWGTRCRR